MDPGSLNKNITYLVGVASDLLHKRVTEVMRHTGLDVTVEQFTILTILWYEDGLPQLEIASRSNRDKTTITRIINNMEKSSLVVRIPDRIDRRIKYVHLTNKGRSIQEKLAMATGKVYMEAIHNFNSKEISQMASLLNQMINNLK